MVKIEFSGLAVDHQIAKLKSSPSHPAIGMVGGRVLSSYMIWWEEECVIQLYDMVGGRVCYPAIWYGGRKSVLSSYMVWWEEECVIQLYDMVGGSVLYQPTWWEEECVIQLYGMVGGRVCYPAI